MTKIILNRFVNKLHVLLLDLGCSENMTKMLFFRPQISLLAGKPQTGYYFGQSVYNCFVASKLLKFANIFVKNSEQKN